MANFIKEKGVVLKFVNAMLACCQKPIREEQVWALCYECCCRMDLMGRGPKQWFRGHLLHDTESTLVIHKDGSVSFTAGPIPDALKRVKTDKDVIYCLGWILYKALDWGIPCDQERDLSQPLEELLCAMLGFDSQSNKPGKIIKPNFTFKTIIEVCEKRLVNPLEAEIHYREVCKEEFPNHCPKKIKLEDLDVGSPNILNKWNCLWRNVINEMRNGIRLRNAAERLYKTLPVEYTVTPFEHLMDDIRYRRYTLQKVTVTISNRRSLHASFLDFICSRPVLKPASERKLKERSREQPSLHELLMTEIKSAKKLQPCSMEVKSEPPNFFARAKIWQANHCEDSGLAGPPQIGSCKSKNVRKRLAWKEKTAQELEDVPYWRLEYSSEGSSLGHTSSQLNSSSTDLDTDLVFLPVLTSSQMEGKSSSFSSRKNNSFLHRRSRSFESSFQNKDPSQSRAVLSPTTPPTIAQLIESRQATVNSEIREFLEMLGCQMTTKSRVCFSCHKKKLFFTWPYECRICDSVVCPDCCTEMLMPFKHCIHLPVSFLKTLMMTRDEDPATQTQRIYQFCNAVRQWDCSRVPVVFEPHENGEEVLFHKKAMRDWFSMDLCTKCKQYLLDVIDANQRCRAARDWRRSRTVLESF
ncbi:protein spire homolog 1-like [Ambystoma mexicanum]|uniref:protein spire homolog 1-like n=1 Tax=Ambystoma mexicanum TaxID=8296 RepID=UPI0037E7976F